MNVKRLVEKFTKRHDWRVVYTHQHTWETSGSWSEYKVVDHIQLMENFNGKRKIEIHRKVSPLLSAMRRPFTRLRPLEIHDVEWGKEIAIPWLNGKKFSHIDTYTTLEHTRLVDELMNSGPQPTHEYERHSHFL